VWTPDRGWEIFRNICRAEEQNFNGYIYIERDSVEPGGNLASVKKEIKYYNDQVNKLK